MPSALQRHKALHMLLLCALFWALSFPFMKTLTLVQQGASPTAGSWFISSLCVMARFFLAGLVLLAFVPGAVKNLSRRELEQGCFLAFFVAAGTCLQMDGLAYISASTSAFLTQLYCVFIPLWVAVSRGRFPTFKILLCCALVLVGMALLVQLNLRAIRLGRGELETIAASIVYTAQILCLENPRYAANRSQSFTVVMLLAIGVLTLPLVMFTAPSVAECFRLYDSLPAAGCMAVLVLICGIIPFLLMNRFQRDVTATEAGLVYCAEPVMVSLLVLFLPGMLARWSGMDYPNEHLTTRLLVGGGLITAANVLLQSRWLEAKRIAS